MIRAQVAAWRKPAPVKPPKASPAEAVVCRRYEALRGAPDSDDRRAAFAALEKLVSGHGVVRCDGVVYTWDWPREAFLRQAPRKSPPVLRLFADTDPLEMGGVLTISEEAWAWR